MPDRLPALLRPVTGPTGPQVSMPAGASGNGRPGSGSARGPGRPSQCGPDPGPVSSRFGLDLQREQHPALFSGSGSRRSRGPGRRRTDVLRRHRHGCGPGRDRDGPVVRRDRPAPRPGQAQASPPKLPFRRGWQPPPLARCPITTDGGVCGPGDMLCPAGRAISFAANPLMRHALRELRAVVRPGPGGGAPGRSPRTRAPGRIRGSLSPMSAPSRLEPDRARARSGRAADSALVLAAAIAGHGGNLRDRLVRRTRRR